MPFPQRLQKLIMLPPQSWKHPQVSMKLPFKIFTSFFSPVSLHQNTHTDWKYHILYFTLMENWSVIVNKILQIIRTVTSSTFLKLFYRLGCCLITCKFSILREIFLFCNFKELQTCNSFRDKWPTINYSFFFSYISCFIRKCKAPWQTGTEK